MKRFTPLLTVLVLLAFAGAAFACPMCKDSIPTSDAQSQGGVPTGFNYSVYLLLGAFLTVLGSIVGLIVKSVHTTPAPSSKRGFPTNDLAPRQ